MRIEKVSDSGYQVLFGPDEDHLREHFEVLLDAMKIHAERERERSGVWRRSGIKGQVFHCLAKAERAFSQAMRGELPNWDNFMDLINYAAFGARLLIAKDWELGRGSQRTDDERLAGAWPWEG